jgi:hypothetical protein
MKLNEEQKKHFKVDHILEDLYLFRGWKSHPPRWRIETATGYVVKRPSHNTACKMIGSTTARISG